MYIDSRHKLFGYLDRLAGWQAGQRPAPVTVEWDLSNRCALGCQDCHFAHTHTRGPWVVKPRLLPMAFDPGGDLADVSLVYRALDEMAQAGVKGVVWSGGGEPTTHPQWTNVVEYAACVGIEQGMYTFGGLLTESTAKILATHAKWVVVSLDCVDGESYAREKSVPSSKFDAACFGIQALSSMKRATIGASFLLRSDNWERAPQMVKLATSLGATYTTIRPTIQTSPDHPSVMLDDRRWITDALPLLHDLSMQPNVELDVERFIEYRDWVGRSYATCYGVRLTAAVTPDGRVWLCPQRRGCVDSCVGDLRKESFHTLWNRHIGQWTDFKDCRVMCRLHLMNQTLSTVYASHEHGAFL